MVDSEDGRHDSVEHFGRPRPVIKVRTVVLPAGIVKQGEKADYSQISTTALGDVESKSINPLPVAWLVD